MARFTYTTKNGTLLMYDAENGAGSDLPFLKQETWPNGTPWGNEREMSDWAKVLISTLLNPDSDIQPGDGPDQPTKPTWVSPHIDPETGLPYPKETAKVDLEVTDGND